MTTLGSSARSRTGARVRWGTLLALLGAAALAGGGAARATDVGGPLPWRADGRMGFTVDACSFPDTTGNLLEVYVRVPPATLGGLVRGPGERSRLRLTAELSGAYGGSGRQKSQEFEIDPADSTGGFGKVVLLRFATRPGAQRLKVKLEDLNSRKRGLVFLGRKVPKSGEVEGEIEVPTAQQGREVSDLEFIWSEEPGSRSDSFSRSGWRMIPNPERLYGLLDRELRAVFVARGLAGDLRSWRWVARLLNPQGEVMAQQESTATGGRWLSAAIAMDVSHQLAGGYDLEVKAWQEGDSGAVLRRSHLSIAWEPDSWLRNPREVQDIVHFLLSENDEQAFALMAPGEQERFLSDFWAERDPSPGTPVNEARDEFLRRVARANSTYGRSGLEPGMFSDMGRVYIRYGEPSEILRQVIPTGDNTLREALLQLSMDESRPIGDVQQKGLGGDMRPFEVWIYEGDIPLPPDADPHVDHRPNRRLVFLFVDEQGSGDYRLRYSTE